MKMGDTFGPGEDMGDLERRHHVEKTWDKGLRFQDEIIQCLSDRWMLFQGWQGATEGVKQEATWLSYALEISPWRGLVDGNIHDSTRKKILHLIAHQELGEAEGDK